MMHFRWTGANGTVLDIKEPASREAMPGYIYTTSSGLGGSGVDIKSTQGAYQNGSTFLGALLIPRNLSITFVITAASKESLWEKRRLVAAAFSTYAGEGIWSWIQGSRTFSLRCTVSGTSPSFPAGAAAGETWQTVIVDLEACDPCWYEEATEFTLVGVSGGLTFPATFPARFAQVNPSVTFTNPGSEASPVLIRVSGPTVNPILRNVTTDEEISLTVELLEGEYLDIDTTFGSPSCRDQDGINRIGYVDPGSTFWQVAPGENTLQYGQASGSAVVLIQYEARYSAI